MKLITDGKELSKLLIKLMNRHDRISFAVAWASSGTKVFDCIMENRNKIQQSSIGTKFYQTDPKVLSDVVKNRMNKRVHFVFDDSGVFHPKLYYFSSDDGSWDLVVGSANMTRNAFSLNTEVCVHISSEDGKLDKMEESICEFLENVWETGKCINKQDVNTYAEDYESKHEEDDEEEIVEDEDDDEIEEDEDEDGDDEEDEDEDDEEIEEDEDEEDEDENGDEDIQKMEWDEYHEAIQLDQWEYELRRTILRNFQEWFKTNFYDLDEEQRRNIAGIGPDGNYFAFGGMRAVGNFRHEIITKGRRLRTISEALACIPRTGDVTRENYDDFVKKFKRVFPKGSRVGVACASRLLMAKRPDTFICYNGVNRDLLEELFGIRIRDTYDYGVYWDIIQKITGCAWWKSPEPQNADQKWVWRARAAMLDSLAAEDFPE